MDFSLRNLFEHRMHVGYRTRSRESGHLCESRHLLGKSYHTDVFSFEKLQSPVNIALYKAHIKSNVVNPADS